MGSVTRRAAFLLAVLSLLCVAGAPGTVAGTDARAIPAIVVPGVLLDATGSPVKGVILHAAALDTDGRAFIEVREDSVLNPTGTTDENGRFAITVPVAFFATGSAFTVGAVYPALPRRSSRARFLWRLVSV